MTKDIYTIKLIPGHKATSGQNHMGYLWDAVGKRIARYTRGEAAVKARLLHAKAEKHKRLNFYTALMLLTFLTTNAYAERTKVVIPPITNYVIDIPHKNAQYVGSHGSQWQHILDSGELKTKTTRKPKFSDLQAVQQSASLFSYKANGAHWQTPNELTTSMQGDCKDVAIWKYKKLKERGWQPENMNLWVVKIKNKELNDGQLLQHMILTVKIDNEEWLLNSPAFWGDRHPPRPVLITPEYMQSNFEFMYRFNENGATLN